MNVIECLNGHKGDFNLVTDPKSEKYLSYCMICHEPVTVPFYSNKTAFFQQPAIIPFYTTNDVFNGVGHIHKSCGQLLGEINHPLHPQHPLKLSNFIAKQNRKYIRDQIYNFDSQPEPNPMFMDFACDVCFTFSTTFKYACEICDKRICYPCISSYVESVELKPRAEKLTPCHPHKLQLTYLSPRLEHLTYCCCCGKVITDFGYFCVRCEFYTHESCVSDIPEQIKCSFHPQHPLKIIHLRMFQPRFPYNLGCKVCPRKIKNVAFGCGVCNCRFHVSCGTYTSPGLEVNGDVTLFYINDYYFDDSCCGLCHEKISQAHMYRLLDPIKNFHVECLVPPTLDHPCHHRPLTLISSVERKTVAEKYRCDVCEEEEDFDHYVYHCMEGCDFNAHIDCVFTQEDEPLRVDLNPTKHDKPLEPKRQD